MECKEILIENIKGKCGTESFRSLSKKINISVAILLNWSSGRSSPSLKQIDDIAFLLNIYTPLLLKKEQTFDVTTPVWKEGVRRCFLDKTRKLKSEKEYLDLEEMNMRNFLLYINGKRKLINCLTLDKIAKMFNVEVYELLEGEKEYEKENLY